jgi:hypothetical protein
MVRGFRCGQGAGESNKTGVGNSNAVSAYTEDGRLNSSFLHESVAMVVRVREQRGDWKSVM